MNFSLGEHQEAFRESVHRVVTDLFPFERRQAAVATEQGYRDEDWQQFVDLGCMAAPFPEQHGGLGGGPVELMVIAEQFGRGLVSMPYLASVVLGGHAVLFGGNEEQRSEMLPGVADGTLGLALACSERQARFDLHDVATTARADGGDFLITGQKDVVLYGGAADRLVVAARTSGGQRDRGGITLFVVPADAEGIMRSDYGTHDGGRASTILFGDVRVGPGAVLGEIDDGLGILEQVIDGAAAFVCADAVGSMWQVFETTLEYLKTRRQFGQTLGSFQVLQHRMVDVYMECELARSMVHEAVHGLGREASARRYAVSSAKALIGEAARRVCEEGVQLHGGIGMTMDVPVGHHLKRVLAMNAMFGDSRHHLVSCSQAARQAA